MDLVFAHSLIVWVIFFVYTIRLYNYPYILCVSFPLEDFVYIVCVIYYFILVDVQPNQKDKALLVHEDESGGKTRPVRVLPQEIPQYGSSRGQLQVHQPARAPQLQVLPP